MKLEVISGLSVPPTPLNESRSHHFMDVFESGYLARECGKCAVDDNPHRKGTVERELFKMGWVSNDRFHATEKFRLLFGNKIFLEILEQSGWRREHKL